MARMLLFGVFIMGVVILASSSRQEFRAKLIAQEQQRQQANKTEARERVATFLAGKKSRTREGDQRGSCLWASDDPTCALVDSQMAWQGSQEFLYRKKIASVSAYAVKEATLVGKAIHVSVTINGKPQTIVINQHADKLRWKGE